MLIKQVAVIAVFTVSIALVFTLIYELEWFVIHPNVMVGVGWIVASVLTLIVIFIKVLVTWILTCLILGVFVGLDFPNFARALQPLSQAFIKLVKTIVGPILFATLVFGIAGHSDLKSVGRMAWKSMLYFVSATTSAIFIGL